MSRAICCPTCRSTGTVTEYMVGKAIRCSGCSATFLVETVLTPLVPPAAPIVPEAPVAPEAPAPESPVAVVAPVEKAFAEPVAPVTPVESTGANQAAGPYESSPGLSVRIAIRAIRQWVNNADATFGAAMAFYAVFAIVPVLFLIIVAWGYIRGDDRKDAEVRKSAETFLGKKLGEETAAKLSVLTEEIKSHFMSAFTEHQFVPLLVTIGIHIASVLALFVQTRAGVCVIWKIQPANSFALICFDYLLALTLVGLTALSLVVSLIFGTMPDGTILPGEEAISFIILTLALGVTFKVLSAHRTTSGKVSYRIPWGYVWYGSLITSALFLLGKNLLQWYLIDTVLQSDLYWRGGLLMVFILWVYYCSVVFFFGAELIQARMTRSEWDRPAQSSAGTVP